MFQQNKAKPTVSIKFLLSIDLVRPIHSATLGRERLVPRVQCMLGFFPIVRGPQCIQLHILQEHLPSNNNE